MTKKFQSESEEQLLGAYFDGELTPENGAALVSRLQHDGMNIAAELDALRDVREEFRRWSMQEMTEWEGTGRQANAERGVLWDRLERELRTVQRERAERPETKSPVIRSFRDWLQALVGGRSSPAFGRSYTFGIGATLACGLLAVVFITRSADQVIPPTELAFNTADEQSVRIDGGEVSVNDALTRGEVYSGLNELPKFGTSGLPILMVPEQTTSNYLRQLLEAQAGGTAPLVAGRSSSGGGDNRLSRDDGSIGASSAPAENVLVSLVPHIGANSSVDSESMQKVANRDQMKRWGVHLPARKTFGRVFVLGGLQAEGADILSIASTGSVDLLPTERRGEPPVIWVSRSAR